MQALKYGQTGNCFTIMLAKKFQNQLTQLKVIAKYKWAIFSRCGSVVELLLMYNH